jgi:inorganic pyrophosphatase
LTFNHDLGVFELGKPLPAGLVFPFDFGFIPGTRADDGDPVDALVLHDTPTHPGVLIACEVAGAIVLEEDGDGGRRIRNDRVLAVPARDHGPQGEKEEGVLSEQRMNELEQFFEAVSAFDGKRVKVRGWVGRAKAWRLVRDASAGRSRR